ncbi:rCG61977, isoform CRA_a [Rattus norvegicus]|uniref:Aryl hydrocarbon receptor n=2 Tax=Rattus norvegicus TaxID=10116 RepID=A6HB98_RAT|nr:aryl hydrocarbon receptor isoform 2 [Rattus norvegicus]EDM03301.1 rCG61977, isoform CRA_a [Rattus norvegicus]EDM03303.1 rCG61977, isoform CRA_a [Rattus norvegicus]|eukprot:NP_001295183.1 aryl hydrocarbon receptor isoform 2 [Rattus norvegicus]
MSSGANITYASRKRRKPVQKTVKPVPAEGIKSNPSKRHRDRLNTELDRLASLLPFPQDVISKLDKLSVLRLSVSYLRAKSFFDVALKSTPADRSRGQDQCRAQVRDWQDLQEGEFLLQALNGFVLVVTADALVFYASSTIQDYLGFQQSDVIHQSVYELIHTEDRAEFQRQLHWALNPSQCTDSAQGVDETHGLPQPAVYYTPDQLPPENTAFMERCFRCRLRCLLDNSSGFLAMNFQGRLKYLHGQNKKGKDGALLPPQLALFAIATPLQPPSILEIRTKNFIFRTKHKLDFTPIGCDAKGQLILGYTEVELCNKGSGYQFIHAADMLHCAESHIRMIKTGESGMTVFRLLAKHSRWRWVQSNARLIYRNGRPDYIIATQRPLTDEEGREHLQKRSMTLPFMFATGKAVLYEISSPFSPIMDPLPIRTKSNTSRKDWAPQSTPSKDSFHPNSLMSALIQQDESIYLCPPSSPAPLDSHFLMDSMSECGSWQGSFAAASNEALLKHEEIRHTQDVNLTLSGGPSELFPDNKNNDLYSIMRNLGIDFEDIRSMQNEEFFRTDSSGEVDFKDIDITDEILTYVQDSLNNSTLLNSACQQQPVSQHLSCMLQERLQLEQQQQLQQQHPTQTLEPQRQLCQVEVPQHELGQKTKHMQVNGMFASWNPAPPVSFSCPQQERKHYSLFSGLQGTAQEFPYKSEVDSMPYTQNFAPCNQSLLPEHSKGTQLDFPGRDFERSLHPNASNLEDFVSCLQVPENQRHGINSQSAMVSPQAYYAGAMSMYQCQAGPQHTPVDQMQYSPEIPGSQAFLSKVRAFYRE